MPPLLRVQLLPLRIFHTRDADELQSQCRTQFAERLEVIAYPERERRRTVGIALGVCFFELIYLLFLVLLSSASVHVLLVHMGKMRCAFDCFTISFAYTSSTLLLVITAKV